MKEPTTTWMHNGTEISMNQFGEFVAKVGGLVVKAVSLPAMKKRLDKTSPFEQFKAFTINYYDKLEEHTIVGIQKNRGYPSYTWKDERGHTYQHVYRDTPQARANLKKYLAAKEAHAKIVTKQETLEAQLKENIGPHLAPENLKP